MKCEQLHCNPTYPSATQDTMEVYVDVPELPSPTPGMYLSIQVTVVANSFRFYCVLPHGMKNLECAFTDDDDENLETMQVNKAIVISFDMSHLNVQMDCFIKDCNAARVFDQLSSASYKSESVGWRYRYCKESCR